MSQRLIEIPIEESISDRLTVNLLETSKGGGIAGYLKQYDRNGVVIKNMTSGRVQVTVNGDTHTVPGNTTDSVTDVEPATVTIEPTSDNTIQPGVFELLVIASKGGSNGNGIASSVAKDVVPFSNTLGDLLGGGS